MGKEKMTVLYCWNVNGLRAVIKNGFLDWFKTLQPHTLCLQETRLLPEEVPTALLETEGYHFYWNPAEKRGYSGTATFTKAEADNVTTLGVPEFDKEGRAQFLHYKDYVLVNTYWPNSQEERKRLPYKLDFCVCIGEALDSLVQKGKNVILCGDYNIAHTEIDLARPKQNENSAGYYIEEREAMTEFLARGYEDLYRNRYPDKVGYTWWSYRSGARKRNIGWRIDYFCVNTAFQDQVEDTAIRDDVFGSDHCPLSLTLKSATPSKGKK